MFTSHRHLSVYPFHERVRGKTNADEYVRPDPPEITGTPSLCDGCLSVLKTVNKIRENLRFFKLFLGSNHADSENQLAPNIITSMLLCLLINMACVKDRVDKSSNRPITSNPSGRHICTSPYRWSYFVRLVNSKCSYFIKTNTYKRVRYVLKWLNNTYVLLSPAHPSSITISMLSLFFFYYFANLPLTAVVVSVALRYGGRYLCGMWSELRQLRRPSRLLYQLWTSSSSPRQSVFRKLSGQHVRNERLPVSKPRSRKNVRESG